MPAGWTAAAIGGSALLSAGTSMIAGGQSAAAAKKAADLQAQQFQQTRGDLLPYNEYGQSVLPNMQALAFSGPYGPGGKNYLDMAEQNLPLNMTQAQLEQTPGYQFTLAQGLKSTQSAAAARGLGVSGAALKGASKYATGLADQTYQARFGEAQTRFSDIYNLNQGQQSNLAAQYKRMTDLATIGEGAATQTGTLGTAAAKTEGQGLMSAGQYQAAGTQGVGSAATGAVNNYLSYNLLKDQIARSGTQTPAAGTIYPNP